MSHFVSISAIVFTLITGTASFCSAGEFPGAEWPTASVESVHIDAQKLKAWTDYALTETKDRKTDGLLIIRHGKLVYEKYQYGYQPTMRHLSWSMAKSFTAVLFGIAESENFVSRDTKMVDVYNYPSQSEAEKKLRDQVTLYHLLTMSSGLEWRESYSKTSPLHSDVTQMLYMEPERNMGAFVASRAMKDAPGEHFMYSTGSTMLVMDALRHKMAKDAYDHYPWEKLFNKIGMTNVAWERDDAGTFAGGSYVYATARDYARFGYLLLNNGRWKNEQVVPTEWMKVIKTQSPGFTRGSVTPGRDGEEKFPYGAGFWLNTPAPRWNLPMPYPHAPADTFMAIGHDGQTIVMIPSKDMVIVRIAHDNDNGIDLDLYLKLLLASVDQKRPGFVVIPEREEGIPPATRDPYAVNSSYSDLPEPGAVHSSPVYLTGLIASVRAKDFCSCHFVVGQTVAFCKERVLNGYPLVRMSMNEAKKSVTFGVLPSKTAYFISNEYGCAYHSR